jgi:DNA repair protein RadC
MIQQTMPALRLREKLINQGVHCLSDTELLAIFISSGSGKQSCLQLAYALIKQLGDVRAILNASQGQFQQVQGLGVVRYLQLQAAREICRRSDFINLQKNQQLKNAHETYTFIKRQLRDNKNETFAALFLDSQHRVICYEELFHGTINAASVYTRPLVERALVLHAAAIIIAHNHPSGLSDPSQQDFQVTERIRMALELVDIQLIDHLVVGDNEVFSIVSETKWVCH